ncbi:MAG: trigger factor [Arenicellales bacterium]
MKVTVENQEGIERKISITLDADVYDKAVKSNFARYAKSAKTPGFRAGKTPQRLLEQQFSGLAVKDAIDNLINEYYPKALQQEKLVPASLLSITPTETERGKAFSFDVLIEVYPEIDKPSIDGIQIDQTDVAVEDVDIDRTVESIQQRQVQYTESKKAAAKGNQVIIDFKGSIDGEVFGGAEATDASLVLGDGRFMQEFEDNLKGAKKGDEKTFEVSFPKDYHGAEVAGKTAEFVVQVKQVNAGKLPTVDNDFAKAMGVEGGVKTMREEISAGLSREMNQKLRNEVRDQVFEALVKKYDIAIPKSPVEEEIDRAIAEISKQMKQQNVPDSGDMLKRENYEKDAKHRVKLGLLVRAVVENEKIVVDQDRLKNHIMEMAGNYDQPEQFIQHVMGDDQQRNQFAGIVLEEQVVEFLLKGAKIKKVKKSYEDFMKPA